MSAGPGGPFESVAREAHALPVEEALRRLATTAEGLRAEEARSRLETFGPNALVGIAPVSAARVLWDQFRSPVVALLAAAAAGGLVLGETVEALAVLAVLAVNVVIGFATEWRARSAMEALRRTDRHQACVRRDGREIRIDARDVVPGDVLDLDPGEAVTADARVIESHSLRVVEAALTGESEPVRKQVDPVTAATVLPDRLSMVFKGTMVAAGTGRAVVVSTGLRTEIGRVGLLVAETQTQDTPLERRLAVIGKQLVFVSLAIAALVAVVGILQGRDTWEMVQTGIALAIAAVPEGLPIVATICLALGMRRMARRRAIVRRLPAVETLGSVTVICADKTGTLTAGEMIVTDVWAGERAFTVSGAGYEPIGAVAESGREVRGDDEPALRACVRAGALANEATLERRDGRWSVTGDPTEGALLVLARKAGMPRADLDAESPEEGEIPFSSERMWMGSVRLGPAGEPELLVKGAPGRVLELCSRRLDDGATEALAPPERRRLREVADSMASRGLRVLALACGAVNAGASIRPQSVCDLTLLGFVGMRDAPAAGVLEAVATLRAAGVRPLMITGDHRLTATAVARDLAIAGDGDATLDGAELERLTDDELAAAVERTAVFSRVSPAGKLRIVGALQARGEIVGMLGDGVNDAPALKKADIGVAMGRRGTDVAKETAGLVLQDDGFPTIAAAVEEGRVIFDNIRKFIFFLFSCNVSEVLLLLGGAAAGLPIPLSPLQILWLNFVTDVFPALALATEPSEPDVLRRPPRDPDEAVLSRRFNTSLLAHAAVLTAAALGVFLFALSTAPDDVARARTMTFMAAAFGQTLHALNARSARPVVFGRRLFRNGWMWGAIALVAVIQATSMLVPGLRRLLQLQALTPGDWAVVAVAACVPLALGQFVRLVRTRRAEEA